MQRGHFASCMQVECIGLDCIAGRMPKVVGINGLGQEPDPPGFHGSAMASAPHRQRAFNLP